MRGKHRLLAATGAIAMLVTAAIIGEATTYQGWKQTEIQRLQRDSKIMDTPFGPVEYYISGSGPAILVAHGSPGGYDLGVALQKLIGMPNFTYISISRPGYLRTPLTTGKTPEEQADLYACILDILGIQRASIVGISGGGPSAIQFSLRHRERCSGLILISAVTQYYSETALKQHRSLFERKIRNIYEKLTVSDPFFYLILQLARLPLPGINPTLFDLLRTALIYEKRQIGYANDLRQFEAITDYPLEQIAAPTFAVHGTADNEVPFGHAELLQRKVPKVRLFVIPHGKHVAFFTHTSIVMPHLRLFLQETESS